MRPKLLILRPEPGAAETAARAAALGFEAVTAPIFTIRPLDWEPPTGPFGAVMITSANAPRHGGSGLMQFLHLPCYAVGAATAVAARGAGFIDVRTGGADAAALIDRMEADGVVEALHLAGLHTIPLGETRIHVERRPVYVSEVVEHLPPRAYAAVGEGALVLVHSPRAGACFARLADRACLAREAISLAAISPNAASALGNGWRTISVAPEPRDQALLELAAELCQIDGGRQERGA